MGPQAITPPAFLFHSLTMSNSRAWALEPIWEVASRSGEVAAYMGRSFPRQHPFLRSLQKADLPISELAFETQKLPRGAE